MQWILRRATEADAPAVEALYVEMLRTIYRRADVQGYAPGDLDRFFCGGEDWICVAEAAGQVIAFLSMEVHREAQDYIYLDDFCVAGAYRNRGIGTQLLGVAKQFAGEIGFACIALHVEKSNAAARRLYEKHGYGFLRDDGSRILMSKQM